MPTVEIFHANMCWACDEAMDFFRGRGVPFDAHLVVWKGEGWQDSEATRRMLALCGEAVDFVPQIFIDGRHVKGWKELSELIESGEIEAILGA